MKTIKIIDLLNKIANGEEVPKKVEYCWTNFYYDENGKDYLSIANQFNSGGVSIFKYIFGKKLNDEAEIIEEEKKIKKLPIKLVEDNEHYDLKVKINELIDIVNDMKSNV